MKKEFRIDRSDAFQRVFRLAIRATNDGRYSYAQPLVYSEKAEGQILEPVVELIGEEAQQLMDELWSAGLRPTEGAGSAGSLAATERHLKDMRTLLGHSTGAPL